MRCPTVVSDLKQVLRPSPAGIETVPRRAGYTLVEILIATALSLILMAAVVRVFAALGTSINNSRAALESSDRLRAAAALLRLDLEGVTAKMIPPRYPEDGEGYFEYIEGPIVLVNGVRTGSPEAIDSVTGAVDRTIGDNDDVLLFTTRCSARPFVGRRCSMRGGTKIVKIVESDVAEVAWFLRGKTLHRRVLLVSPSALQLQKVPTPPEIGYPGPTDGSGYYAKGFYMENDISVYPDPQNPSSVIANTLSSLTKRECRYGHPSLRYPPTAQESEKYPYNVMRYPSDARGWKQLGLPTLRECAAGAYSPGDPTPDPGAVPSLTQVDLWSGLDDGTQWLTDWQLGGKELTTRIADDVVLTNVIGFDVKVWDNVAQQYVDLSTANAVSFAETYFARFLNLLPDTHPSRQYPGRMWDTWSLHYENEGVDAQHSLAGRSTNGFDDNVGTIQVVDGEAERIAPPPYPVRIRGVQVKIRVFEPDSRQIREVTIEQDFLPK